MKLINIVKVLIGATALVAIVFLLPSISKVGLQDLNTTQVVVNNSTNFNESYHVGTSNDTQGLDDSLKVPPNEYVVENINWTSYPNLQKGYVLAAYIAKPNSIISHDFIEVQICSEVKNCNDKTQINKQLSGVAREARSIYGPNSGINIFGTIGGVEYYYVAIRPYEDDIYCRGG